MSKTAELKHTEGPWVARFNETKAYDGSLPQSGTCSIENERQTRIVAHVVTTTLEDKANAHIIAAAPEMLNALQETLDYWDSTGFSECDPECDCIVQIVQAAIKKATER